MLLRAALRSENLLQTFKRVRANKGAAGGMVGTSTKHRAILPWHGRIYGNNCWMIDRLGKRIDDAGVIRLVRAYLNGRIMVSGRRQIGK